MHGSFDFGAPRLGGSIRDPRIDGCAVDGGLDQSGAARSSCWA
jgi:hypothetical protein